MPEIDILDDSFEPSLAPGKVPGTGLVEEYRRESSGKDVLERRRIFTDIGERSPSQSKIDLPPQFTSWHLQQTMDRDAISKEEATNQMWDEYAQTGTVTLWKPDNQVPGLPQGYTYGRIKEAADRSHLTAEDVVKELKWGAYLGPNQTLVNRPLTPFWIKRIWDEAGGDAREAINIAQQQGFQWHYFRDQIEDD